MQMHTAPEAPTMGQIPMMEFLHGFFTDNSKYVSGYHGDTAVMFIRDHAEIPTLAVVAYLTLIFYVPDKMKSREAFNLRWSFCFWNLFLAVFSIFGTYYTVPALIDVMYYKGLRHSVCGSPDSFYYHHEAGAWVALFCFSKIPELIDTVFLVFQKKQVIFLHWFHHTTVMLYCWHAIHNQIAGGLWFAAMNFTVHAIMYSYYFCMSLSKVTRNMVKPLAMSITSLQILQMVVGMFVSAATRFYMETRPETKCYTDNANNKLGLMMYFSYFVLFGALFRNHYCNGAKRDKAKQGEDKEKKICSSAATETFTEMRSGRETSGSGSSSPSPTNKKRN